MSVSTLLRRLDSAHAPTAIHANSSAHAVGLSHAWSVSIHANIAAPVVQLYAPNAHVPTPTIRCHLAHVGLAISPASGPPPTRTPSRRSYRENPGVDHPLASRTSAAPTSVAAATPAFALRWYLNHHFFCVVSSQRRRRRDEPRGSHGEPVREPRRAPTLALADGSGGIRQVLSTAAGGFAAGGAGSLAVVCRVRLWLFCDGVGGERVLNRALVRADHRLGHRLGHRRGLVAARGLTVPPAEHRGALGRRADAAASAAPPFARGARRARRVSSFSPAPSSVPTTNVCSNANQVS